MYWIEQFLQRSFFFLHCNCLILIFIFSLFYLAHCNTPLTFDPYSTLRYASSSSALSGVHLCSVFFFFYSCLSFWLSRFFPLCTNLCACSSSINMDKFLFFSFNFSLFSLICSNFSFFFLRLFSHQNIKILRPRRI